MTGAATTSPGSAAAGLPDPGWLTAARISDAVIATDPAGGVRFLNPAAEALLGVKAEAALGRPLQALFQVGGADPAEESLAEQAIRRRQPVSLADARLLLANGSARRVAAHAAAVASAGGEPQGVVISLRELAVAAAPAPDPQDESWRENGDDYGGDRSDDRHRREHEKAIHQAYAELDRRAGERRRVLARAATVLRDSSMMLETFAAGTPELIFVSDREGCIVMVNPAALQALGMRREEVIGRRDLILFGDPAEAAQIRASERQIIDGGEALTVEHRLQTPAGLRSYLLTKSPLRDEAGEIIGIVGVAIDFTERNRARRELEYLLVAEHQLRGEAERANRAKDDFLAVVSHELRSPLNALKGWSHVLASPGELDPLLVRRGAEAIKRNVEHQARLIDDLLDTSCITIGRLEIERRPVNLVEVAQSALELSRDSARSKQIAVHFAAGQPRLLVSGDDGRLRQVVINLLSNAIKFTPPGGRIDVALHLAGQRVELSVSDNGIGIEPEFLPQVFNRFSQADSSTIRRYRGLGIGLTLARYLVELHGGSIVAASPGSGHGATFTARLPLLDGDQSALAEAAPAPSPARRRLHGVRLMLVDDDADAREIVRIALVQAGAEVQACGSGRETLAALRAADARMPAVLLLDIAMPDQNGFELLAEIRSLPGLPFIPAVALTALSHLERQQFGIAGFQECLGKPLDIERLIETVARLAEAGREVAPTRLNDA